MNRNDMNNMTVTNLRVYALDEPGLTGISKLKKADLIDKMVVAIDSKNEKVSKEENTVEKIHQDVSTEAPIENIKKRFINRAMHRKIASIERKKSKNRSVATV